MKSEISSRFRFALISIVFTVIITAGAVAFIRRGVDSLFIHWQESAFYIISLITAVVGAFLGFGLHRGEKETKEQRALVWGGILVAFLYVASCALCERLNVFTIDNAAWRALGVGFLLAGAILRLWSIAVLGRYHSGLVTIQEDHKLVEIGPYKRLRNPSYLGVLVACIGIPMVFGTWFPLFAIPGIFVTLKWRMDAEEALLGEHFGEDYARYKKTRWRIIPFLY